MLQLSADGQQLVHSLAQKHGLSEDAVTHMLIALQSGNGGMAQFNHPEFGGYGQWMRGGMTMVSDLFNHQLKARVDNICLDLANALSNHQLTPFSGSFQSQRQSGGNEHQAQVSGHSGQNSLFVKDPQSEWWPTELGSPSAVGSQNNVGYAYFSHANRLAVKTGHDVWVYDTQNHQIGGFSQQQGSGGSISFASQYGTVNLATLPVVSRNGQPQAPTTEYRPDKTASEASPAATTSENRSTDDAASIFQMLESLGALKEKGYITDAEFNEKKAELLKRL